MYSPAHRHLPPQHDLELLEGEVARLETLELPSQSELTGEWSVRMFQSVEGTEGITAFREKRKPNWVTDE